MTPEIQETITTVVKRLSHKYVFGPYELEDIEQEAWIRALKILDSWDGNRPLENYMMVSLNNRMKNFKRDYYYRQGTDGQRAVMNEQKKQLMNKAEEYLDIHITPEDDPPFFSKEEIENLVDKLPYTIRSDFYKLANNVTIPSARKAKVYEEVRKAYEENGQII